MEKPKIWNRELVELLILKYKEHENLYNARDPAYLDRVKRSHSLFDIYKRLKQINKNATVEEIKNKIHSLRTQFIKELREIENRKSNVCIDDVYEPRLWCFSQLEFLRSHCGSRKLESKISNVRLEKKRRTQHHDKLKSVDQSAWLNENDSFCDTSSRTLESQDSYSGDSTGPTSPAIVVKEEGLFENPLSTASIEIVRQENHLYKATDTPVQSISDEEGNGENLATPSKFQTHYETDPEDPLDVPSDDLHGELVEPLLKKRRVTSYDSPNEPSFTANQDDFEPLTRNKKRSIVPEGDTMHKSSEPPKADKFEQWLRKRKQILEVEYLEMQNYEMKLKIWAREQQLKLPRSKFTKDIPKCI